MALSRDNRLNRIADPLSRASLGIAADANEIYESAFVQLTAGGFAVKVGDSGGLGVGPVVGVSEKNVADNTGNADGDVSSFFAVGLFERPIATLNPATEADMWRTVYASDDEQVCSDNTKPVLGLMVGFNATRGTNGYATVLIGPVSRALAALFIGSAPLLVTSFYETDGTPLAAFADGDSPTPGLSLNDSEAAGVRWNNHATPAAIVGIIAVPPDLDPSKPAYVILPAAKTGATAGDTPKLTLGIFAHPVGLAYDAGTDLGGDTNAMVGTAAAKTVQALAYQIAADSIPDPSGGNLTMTITIDPEDGELGTDDLILFPGQLVYSRV